MSALVSPSLVDWESFTAAQRESLIGLALGDRGAELRRHSGKTAASLARRDLIERRPAGRGVVPGWRLTAQGQATVIARGWVSNLVLRSDDVLTDDAVTAVAAAVASYKGAPDAPPLLTDETSTTL